MPTRLSPSDLYTLHSPSRCELRVWLLAHGEVPAPPGAFERMMEDIGRTHERHHLDALGPDVISFQGLPRAERERLTRQAVADGAPAIYQPALRAEVELDGERIEVVGDPDFLIRTEEGYLVRDAKIAREITEKDHPEIFRQLALYGWLYERTFEVPPTVLEVYAGTEEIVPLPYDGAATALHELAMIRAVRELPTEPYEPVGWSKCHDCGFKGHCWPRAVGRDDVSLVVGVDQGLARRLYDDGVRTIAALGERFDPATLAELKRPWGTREQRVGTTKAPAILRSAEALRDQREILVEPPAFPECANYVMFDLEGLQAILSNPEIIYLWGLQVFGERTGAFQAAVLEPGDTDDEGCWRQFLTYARTVRAEHGEDIPWVHWASYEKTHVTAYIERWGDPDGTAQWVLSRLVDALPITQRAIALPLYSYSLKEIEKYLGYERSQEEFGGTWAMVKYIEAAESGDPAARQALMREIVKYNREDLEAMWAVVEWLRDMGGRGRAGAGADER
ncbi:MAG TPA: TM0106 family RecB-like putative nuclease [Gemmatimonadales bacterium]|nr:TM0106 family RecB-like putative nuclease [Gemmatimonadales bacterium]